MAKPDDPRPMNMLFRLYGDAATAGLLAEENYVRHLVRVEQVVAQAQGELGVVPAPTAAAIVAALDHVTIDHDLLWTDTEVVGYPVLPLIRQIDAQLAQDLRGYLHWGLTTQDVMDTALVLQVREVVARQRLLLSAWGDALAVLTHEWSTSVAPARTHAQHAVPTTIGARFAVFLAQVADLSQELVDAADRLAVVSMHGAGGTSAAMGSAAGAVRRRVAEVLALRYSDVPWHVARQSLVRLTGVQASLAAVAARLAKDVVDLSRNEIGELNEMTGQLRGASSTMPQKANPIFAEAIVGLSWICTSNQVGMMRALEAGHERAAGEWQIEWALLPTILMASSSAFDVSGQLSAGLRVHAQRAKANTALDDETILAEAYMMQVATSIGREEAHELVYRAIRSGVAMRDAVAAEGQRLGLTVTNIRVEDYLGDAPRACQAAERSWARTRALLGATTPPSNPDSQ